MRLYWILLAAWLPLPGQVVPGLSIVELREPASSKAARAAQADVRRAVESLNARVTDTVSTVANALLVEGGDPARLAAVPGVARVWPVFEMKLSLDRALELHQVPQAWARLSGSAGAGAGVKIAIIDSGIEADHPGFQAPHLSIPDGFPKTNQDGFRASTNQKVIVAKSYEYLLGRSLADTTPADRIGHGTGVAMAAAGVRNAGPLGTITGVAPEAWLGNYKVFAGEGFRTRTDVVLKAFDDAVADGMDIINLSLGTDPAPRTELDVMYEAIERAARRGVITVVAAGNNGNHPASVSSPGTAPSAITVGATWNDRVFLRAGVLLESGPFLPALPGNGPAPAEPVVATVADVARFDPTGLACEALPAGSLAGRHALILRGVCEFGVKLRNAAAAGAVAGIVYTDAARPEPVLMDVGGATLPAVMISHPDGVALKAKVATETVQAAVVFGDVPAAVDPNRMASFSARGPSVDFQIKPEISATGVELYTATQKSTPGGQLFHASGYRVVNGTSFSAPLLAGAAAVLKSARPGLRVSDYRSMLIGTARSLVSPTGSSPVVQETGVGLLDLRAALTAHLVTSPATVSFAVGGGRADSRQTLTIQNLSDSGQTVTLTVEALGEGPAPVLSADSLTLGGRETGTVELLWQADSLAPGEFQGFVRITGSEPGDVLRVPYWYAAASAAPAFLSVLGAPRTAAPGSSVELLVRVTDRSGIPIASAEPTATATAGGGSVVGVERLDRDFPGVFAVRLRLGPEPGTNRFRLEAGPVSAEVAITGAR